MPNLVPRASSYVVGGKSPGNEIGIIPALITSYKATSRFVDVFIFWMMAISL